MTRIIAGFAGSVRLSVPRAGTRPTSDRVREAIFSALEARDSVRGAGVVDLYAGSGALGLEAVSRGAERAVLVERDRQAAAVCRRNAATVLKAAGGSASARVDVVAEPARSFLVRTAETFDLAFLDPPYELGDAALADVLELLRDRVAPGATVVVERAARAAEPAWPEGFQPHRTTIYGDTALWRAESPPDPARGP